MPRIPNVRRPRARKTPEDRARVRRLAITAADHLIERRRYAAAASILDNYRNGNPKDCDNPQILRRLGRARMALGEPHVAVELFQRALAVQKKNEAAAAAKSVKVAEQEGAEVPG